MKLIKKHWNLWKARHRHIQTAFSIIELAAVVFILSVIAFTILPHLARGTTAKTPLESEAYRITALIQQAQNLSLATSRMHVLHFDIHNNTCWLTSVPDTHSPAFTQTNSQPTALAPGIQIKDIQTLNAEYNHENDVAIRFSPQGWSDAAAIHLHNDEGNIVTIHIEDLSGKASVQNSYWNMRNSPWTRYQ